MEYADGGDLAAKIKAEEVEIEQMFNQKSIQLLRDLYGVLYGVLNSCRLIWNFRLFLMFFGRLPSRLTISRLLAKWLNIMRFKRIKNISTDCLTFPGVKTYPKSRSVVFFFSTGTKGFEHSVWGVRKNSWRSAHQKKHLMVVLRVLYNL